MLYQRGMTYGGMHTVAPKLEDIGPIVDALGVLKCADLCNSGLYTWENQTAADYRKAIVTFNKAGAALRKAGIHLHYHNHDFEFKVVEGKKRGIDILIEELDPAACDLCVDVAWVTKGGDKPVEFLKKYEKLVGYLHLKDYDSEGWTELGSGVVDIPGVVKLLPKLKGVRKVMCEQDSARIDPLESVAKSRAYLKTLNY
jgi:sugar phosphate isomerase/epimerase